MGLSPCPRVSGRTEQAGRAGSVGGRTIRTLLGLGLRKGLGSGLGLGAGVGLGLGFMVRITSLCLIADTADIPNRQATRLHAQIDRNI